MLKKLFLILIPCFMFVLISAHAAEDIPASRIYLEHGTFDEENSPAAGDAFAGGSTFCAGWYRYSSDGIGTYIVDGENNPFLTGKAVRLIQDYENYSTLCFRATKLNDISKGTEYTNTRVIEMDFQFNGVKGGKELALIRHSLSLSPNSDNKTASLRLYCGNTSTGGPGPNYMIVKSDITMNERHHLKLVYRVIDLSSEEYEAGGDTRTVAVYIDGEKIVSDYVGSYIFTGASYNFLYDSKGSADKLNNGMSTAPSNMNSKGFQIGFWGNATSDDLTQEFYFDNVEYYGLTHDLAVLDENNREVKENGEIERIAKFNIDAVAEGTDSDILLTSAFYNESGKLIRLNTQKTVNIKASKTESLDMALKIPEDIADDVVKVKAFMWEKDKMRPVSVKEELTLSVSDGYAKTLARIKENIMETLYDSSASPDNILSSLNEDGSFSGLDYSDERRSVWDPATHFGRLVTLCRIYSSPRNPHYGNEELKEKTYNSLRFWFNHDPELKCNNWWYNDVQIPMDCYDILMLDKDLPEDLREIMQARVDKSDLLLSRESTVGTLRNYNRNGSALPRAAYYTVGTLLASNEKTDSEKVAQIRDIIEIVNEELLLEVCAAGFGGADIDTECVKADYSYHEHENMLLIASYGWGQFNHLNTLLGYLEGSAFDISYEAKEELSNILLDGFQWMGYKNYWDTTVMGRAISGEANVAGNSTQRGLMKYLLKEDNIKRKDELTARLNRMRYPNQNENFTGNRHFWQSDFTSHNRAGYHFSVKTASTRTRTTEGINGENIIGKYLSDGVINLVKTGTEYEDMAPVWDWNKLPGTTTVQGKTAEELFPTGRPMGTTEFVGGVSSGLYGFGLMDYSRDGVEAKKSYFCFDDEIVMLGAGITSAEEGNIFTSINQCASNGDAVVLSNGETKTVTAAEVLNGVGYVLHDGVGYVFKGNEDVEVKNETVSGSWSRVNTAASTAAVTDDVFLVGIDHGTKPQNAAYEVIILPETTKEELDAYESPITVLSNTAAVQAVWHETLNILQASFFDSGEINLPDNVTVNVDSACGIMIEYKENEYKIYVSNPTNHALDVTVTLSGNIEKSVAFEAGVGERGNDGGRTYYYNSNTQIITGLK